jgi:16S rRNA (uracil1498-N3)-methyltransferase
LPADASPSFLIAPEIPPAGEIVDLPADERRHLFRVCRARSGETATVTDGAGHIARVTVEGQGAGARVRVEHVSEVPRGARAWLCAGAPEGSRADWLVEKLAELGVERFVPIDCRRARWTRSPGRARRWSRLSDAGLRQSRRAWRMDIDEPIGIERLAEMVPRVAHRVFADSRGEGSPTSGPTRDRLHVAVVGPGPGLDPGETERLTASGWTPVRLSGGVLRTETAALAWAALWARGDSV